MRGTPDDAERLSVLEDAVERINLLRGTHIVLVEGLKDIAALESIGVIADFFCVQSGGGPVKAAEHVWRSGKEAVIMTDWDRRGGNLAGTLRENLSSLGVGYDDRIRADMAFACRPYSKDVESLDSVMSLLRSRTEDSLNHNIRDGD